MGVKPTYSNAPPLHTVYLPRAQAKGLLKEPDRLRHIFVFDVLKNFLKTLDQPRRISLDVAPYSLMTRLTNAPEPDRSRSTLMNGYCFSNMSTNCLLSGMETSCTR